MPNTIFQQQLSEVDVSSAKFVSQGVVDTSSSKLVKAIGGTALEVRKGMLERELQESLDVPLASFFERAEEETTRGLLDPRIAGQQELMADLAEQSAGLINPEEDEALQQAKKDLSKLSAMKRQGAASSIELKARFEAITKDFVNKAPGLRQEFNAIASTTVGEFASSIKIAEALRAGKAKDQSKFWEFVQKEATKLGINTIGTPREQWYAEYIGNRQVVSETVQIKQLRDQGVIARERLLADRGEVIANGELLNFRTLMDANINREDIDPVRKQQEISRILSEQIAELNKYNPEGKEDPRVKAMVGSVQDLAKTYSGIADGSIAAEEAKNQVDLRSNHVLQGLMQDDAFAAYSVARKALGDNLPQLVTAGAPVNKVAIAIKDAMNGDTPFNRNSTPEEATQYFTTMRGWVKSINNQDMKQGEAKPLVDAIENTVDLWRRDAGKEQFDGLLSLVADKEFLPFSNTHLPTSTKEALSNPLEKYITDTVLTGFGNKYDPKTMTIQTTEDGRIFVQTASTDPEVIAAKNTINRVYADRLSQYVKAVSHLQGTTNYKSAIDQLTPIITAVSEDRQPEEEIDWDRAHKDWIQLVIRGPGAIFEKGIEAAQQVGKRVGELAEGVSLKDNQQQEGNQ